MGKRSNFERNPKDFYETPINAVKPLIPHLPSRFSLVDPCAGNGLIGEHLCNLGTGVQHIENYDKFSYDYSHTFHIPNVHNVYNMYDADAQFHRTYKLQEDSIFITNPPWTRSILHNIINNLSSMRPTWLLFDADWMHTKQAKEYLEYCHKIVSVGRVSWMGNGVSGMDNCAWYLFDLYRTWPIKFYGRD